MDFRNFSPCLLIAMPELKDPNFEKAVVLLSDYTPEAAVGFVVNKPSELKLGTSVTLSEGEINPGYQDLRLWHGGPVDQQRIWIVYDQQAYDGPHGVVLSPGVCLAQDIEVLLNNEKTLTPSQLKVVNGYAGWGAKQLDAEIAASFWITASITRELLFLTAPEKMWETAIKALGIDATKLMAPQTHFLH